MKKIFLMLLLVVFVGNAFALPPINTRPNEKWWSDTTYQNPLWKWLQEANTLIETGAALGTGSVFYVDSNVTNEGDGSNWANAKDTLDEAINLCTANNGDVIYVAQGHAETVAAANGFDADVAGIKIKGAGAGSLRPTFTFSATASDVAVGAANVTISGLRFAAGISAVVRGISIEATGDNCTIMNCEFPEPTTTSFEFVRAVLLATGADGFHFYNNTYFNVGAVGATNVIDVDTGIVDDLQVIGNLIVGEFAEGAIHSDKVCTNVVVSNNKITNLTASQHAIEFSANAIGFLTDNQVETNAIATAIDNGALSSHNNTWLTPQGADMEAVPVNPAIDSTVTILGANDSSNAYVSSAVTADADGSILERLEALSGNLLGTTTIAGKTYTSVVTATSQTDDLFDVAGGAILITSFTGVVTTEIGAVGNTIAINLDADAGFIDSDFSTAVETNGDVVGTRYLFSNVTESVLTPVSDTAGNTNPMRQWFSGEGMIEQTASGATTGAIKWYMTWIPFADGTTVTAQ